jgi:hypothetical protein
MTLRTFPADEVVQLSQRLHALIGHLDNRRYEAIAGMFTPDGRWRRQGRWHEGRPAILAALEARPRSMQVRHVLTNVLVTECAADEAKVDAYMTAYRQLEGQAPELFSFNTVVTTFRRVAGEWQITEQQMAREFEFSAA